MGRLVEITCFEHSATELRELAARTQDGAVVRRLLAIAPELSTRGGGAAQRHGSADAA